MLRRTSLQARAESQGVRVGDVFRLSPLITKIVLALAVVMPDRRALRPERPSRGDLGATSVPAARPNLAAEYRDPGRWHPNRAHRHRRTARSTVSELMPFDENREIKVAKGTSVLLRVLADATKVIPEYCTVYYQTEENDRGSVNMQKLGRIRDNYQAFAFDGKPFRGILSSIVVRRARLRSPRARLSPDKSCRVLRSSRRSSTVYSRRTWWTRTCRCGCPGPSTWPTARSCPTGRKITLRARANKDLTKVDIRDLQSQQTTVYDVAQAGR